MTFKGNNGGGRRSKGERHLVGSRLPVDRARELFERAEAQGVSVSDYVARILIEHLEAEPRPQPREVLDISA